MKRRIIAYCLMCCVSPALVFASAALNVEHYDIALALPDTGSTFSGELTIDLWPTKRTRTIRLSARDLHVKRVVYEDAAVQFSQSQDQLRVRLPRAVIAQESLRLHITYDGTLHEDGLMRLHAASRDSLSWFVAGAEGYRPSRVFPCHESASDPAFSTLAVTSDPYMRTVAPGALVSNTILESADQPPRRRMIFEQHKAYPVNAVSFLVGQMESVASQWSNAQAQYVPIEMYAPPGRSTELDIALHALREALPFFESWSGVTYPQTSNGEALRVVALPEGVQFTPALPGVIALPTNRLLWSAGDTERNKIRVAEQLARSVAWQWLKWPRRDPHWGGPWVRLGIAEYTSQEFLAHLYGEGFAQWWRTQRSFDGARVALAKPMRPHENDRARAFHAANVIRQLHIRYGEMSHLFFQSFIEGPNVHASDTLLEDVDFDYRPVGKWIPLSQWVEDVEPAVHDVVKPWLRTFSLPTLEIKAAWNTQATRVEAILQQRGRFVPGATSVAFVGKGYIEHVDLSFDQRREALAVDVPHAPLYAIVNRFDEMPAVLDDGLSRDNFAQRFTREPLAATRARMISRLLTRDDTIATARVIVDVLMADDTPLVLWAGLQSFIEHGYRESQLRTLFAPHQRTLIATLRAAPRDLIAVETQAWALELIGVLDDADYYSLLKARMTHPIPDIQLGAMTGLLHTSLPDRFAMVKEALHRMHGAETKRANALVTIAHVPQLPILELITDEYHGDANWVPDIFDALLLQNPTVMFSSAAAPVVSRWCEDASVRNAQSMLYAITQALRSDRTSMQRRQLKQWRKILRASASL